MHVPERVSYERRHGPGNLVCVEVDPRQMLIDGDVQGDVGGTRLPAERLQAGVEKRSNVGR